MPVAREKHPSSIMAGCFLPILLGAPYHADGSPQHLATLPTSPPVVIPNPLKSMSEDYPDVCRLSAQCAPFMETVSHALRRNFFSDEAALLNYCGAPGNYVKAVHAANTATVDVLAQNETWETPFEELQHLPSHEHCVTAMHRAAAVAAAIESTPGRGRRLHRTSRVKGDKAERGLTRKNSSVFPFSDGGSDLVVPLIGLNDVFIGGQYIPFVDGSAYVALSTAEAYGGLAQGVIPSAEAAKGPLFHELQEIQQGASKSASTWSKWLEKAQQFLTAESLSPPSHISGALEGTVASPLTTTGNCCHSTRQNVVDQREKELLHWLSKDNMDRTKSVTYFDHDIIVAHGGGWGDYQGGSGDNYFHTLQALASVSFLLPRLKADPKAKLLIRVCKQPWYTIRKDYYRSALSEDSTQHENAQATGDGIEGWSGWTAGEGAAREQRHNSTVLFKAFRCGVDPYVLDLFRILDIPLRQVAHYPYDEHDPSFSSLSYRFNRLHYQRNSPLIMAKRAILQPPHVQVSLQQLHHRIDSCLNWALLLFALLSTTPSSANSEPCLRRPLI